MPGLVVQLSDALANHNVYTPPTYHRDGSSSLFAKNRSIVFLCSFDHSEELSKPKGRGKTGTWCGEEYPRNGLILF